MTGKELVEFIGAEKAAHEAVYSSLNKVYFSEVNGSTKAESDQLKLYQGLRALVEERAAQEWEALGKAMGAQDPEAIARGRDQLSRRAAEILDQISVQDLSPAMMVTPEQFTRIKEEVLKIQPGQAEDGEYIQEIGQRMKELRVKAMATAKPIKDFATSFKAAGSELDLLHRNLLAAAMDLGERASDYETADVRKQFLMEKAARAKTPEEAQEWREKAESVNTSPPDFDTLTQVFYEAKWTHSKIIVNLRVETQRILADPPRNLSTTEGKAFLEEAILRLETFLQELRKGEQLVEDWAHDLPVSADAA